MIFFKIIFFILIIIVITFTISSRNILESLSNYNDLETNYQLSTSNWNFDNYGQATNWNNDYKCGKCSKNSCINYNSKVPLPFNSKGSLF